MHADVPGLEIPFAWGVWSLCETGPAAFEPNIGEGCIVKAGIAGKVELEFPFALSLSKGVTCTAVALFDSLSPNENFA